MNMYIFLRADVSSGNIQELGHWDSLIGRGGGD